MRQFPLRQAVFLPQGTQEVPLADRHAMIGDPVGEDTGQRPLRVPQQHRHLFRVADRPEAGVTVTVCPLGHETPL